MTTSYLPYSLVKLSRSIEEETLVAPKLMHSSALLVLEVNAVTVIPILAAYITAKCPRPPIPITAHVPLGLTNLLRGA